MKGTFNQGWWNCFESFAAEILSVDKYAGTACRHVLEDAGITKREAMAWLDKGEYRNPAVEEIVRNYYYSIK
jgi:hypothetical protein